jgi:simple sugar transport system ATP-binding protein
MKKEESFPVKMVNIHKWFGGVYALKGVDFSVRPNETVGLIGDNGAGKSTLIKILSGVHPPDEGKIYLEGEEVRFSSPKDAIRMGIETIYQDTAVVNQMSIMRNVFMGREPIKHRLGPIRLLDIKKMAKESTKALAGVDLRLRSPATPVEDLSGGERQGVAIARAMYFKTKILILDEPTNNLSVKESQKVLQFVQGLKSQGISSVFITHNLYHVYPVADRLVVMNRGKKIGDFKRKETSIEELTKLMTLS